LVRGLFGTSDVEHAAGVKVSQVAVFANDADTGVAGDTGENPVDIMQEIILGWVGIAAGSVDSTQFDAERDNWAAGLAFRRIIEKPIQAEKLLAQLRRFVMGNIWQNESQKLTFKILHPVEPHETTTSLTLNKNIVQNSAGVDLNIEDQITRVLVYYNPTDTWGKKDHNDPDDFNAVLIWIDADAETANNYDEERTLEIFADWIFKETEARIFASRYLRRYSDPPAFYHFSMDRKDSAIQTGDVLDITTADFVDQQGADETLDFQVLTKKERRDGSVQVKCLQSRLNKRYGFVAHAGANDWGSATDLEKKHCYVGQASTNLVGTTGTVTELGYHVF
ncbi:hypothetical protein LCGC14_2464040, partial [marine sediment metagenome]